MKIGFDLDSVLCNLDVTTFVLLKAHSLYLEKLYLETRTPLINPQLFMRRDDKGYIITARRPELRELTIEWCRKYVPNLQLVLTNYPDFNDTCDWDMWIYQIAGIKAAVIDHLGIEVYLEDVPEIVLHLRNICTNCKIIQYGGSL